MALSELMVRQIPYLRRYARILTGSQKLGDGLVRELLEAALADSTLRAALSESRVSLFQAFSRIYRSMGDALPADDLAAGEEQTVSNRLHRVTPEARQALLLQAIEDFSVDDIGRILDRDPEDVSVMIEDALAAIEAAGRADVLIIEDEPLIAFQLEELVREMGNQVVGIASTHEEAVALFEARRPGIVLADIQLADGSSGIDAVNEILRDADERGCYVSLHFPELCLTHGGAASA